MTSAGYSTTLSPADSTDAYFDDTMKGGRGINDPKLVHILAEEGPRRLRELVDLGAPLGLDEAGSWRVFPSGDHSVPRTVSAASQTPGGSNPAQLAHGISVALYNTAFGIAISIPSLIFYRHFKNKVDTLVVEMEQQAAKLVDLVHGERVS